MFKIGDLVQFNPESISKWLESNNTWWRGFGINDELVEYITFRVMRIERDFGPLLCLSPVGLEPNETVFNDREYCRLYEKDLVHVYRSKNKQTKEQLILTRIYKLYAKCKTTKHWAMEKKNEL